jgi:hypothetical protein
VLEQGPLWRCQEIALVPGAWLATETGRVSRADHQEPGFGQHLLGRGILAGGGRSPRMQPVARHRQPTRELGISLVAYSPVGRGFLSGAITSPDDLRHVVGP